MAVVSLPDSLRDELKAPAGPIYTDAGALLADAGSPLIAVGDVVTYHLLGADVTPDVALVDEQTKRTSVDPEISARIARASFDHETRVGNPAAVLTEDLLVALSEAIDREGTTLLSVDGEEDLAALPAVVFAPDGASVVYGQPDTGMVLITVTDKSRAKMRDILSRMDGDPERLFAVGEQ